MSCANVLARRGWHVFAGTRRSADSGAIAELATRYGRSVIPLQLDMTDVESHWTAAEIVAKFRDGQGLNALVNNAGTAISAPLEFLPPAELRAQLEVNLVGHLSLTQALLPQLRIAKGRIVNMSSIGGLVAGPILGAYHVSKFGLEAISDSLRREVRAHHVKVVVIEPATVRTSIWDSGADKADELAASMPPEAEALYGHLTERMRTYAAGAGSRGVGPDVVAEVVARAITARRPRARYLVGREARLAWLASRILPVAALDQLLAPTSRAS